MKSITKEQEDFLDECTIGTWKLNTETGLVDVDGNFICAYKGLKDFRGIRFGNIRGFFNCYNNQLVSLEGAPQEVGGTFSCVNNQLVSLEGAPKKVGKSFYCYNNQLVSLEGATQEVGEGFYCYDNQLVSLEGSPQEVQGSFDCSHNKLVSLKWSPRKIKGGFYCYNNKLVSLEGAPQEIGGDFICDPINLRGCPSNFLKRIYFSKDLEKVSLIDVIRNIDDINRLYPEIYLKKIIK